MKLILILFFAIISSNIFAQEPNKDNVYLEKEIKRLKEDIRLLELEFALDNRIEKINRDSSIHQLFSGQLEQFDFLRSEIEMLNAKFSIENKKTQIKMEENEKAHQKSLYILLGLFSFVVLLSGFSFWLLYKKYKRVNEGMQKELNELKNRSV